MNKTSALGDDRWRVRCSAAFLCLLLFATCSCTAKPCNAVSSSTASASYKLTIRLVPETPRLEVSGTIQLPPVDAARSSIELSLSELMNDFHADVVSPGVSSGAVKLEQTDHPQSRSGWGVVTWKVVPAQPFPASQPIVLRFSYARESEGTSFIFGLGKEVSFAGGVGTSWYPQLEDPGADRAGPFKGLRGVGVLDFTVPTGYIVHATGLKRKGTGDGVFHFEVNHPAFFSFGAARYLVNNKNGPIQTSIYSLRSRDNETQFLNGTARILEVLTNEFGAYPFSEFAIVEVPTSQSSRAGFDGASIDSFIFVNSDYLDKGFNTAFFGHEISHQWWGNLIISRGVEGRWMMSEGMAQFGSLRAVEVIEGEAAAAQYRRIGYPGYVSDQCALGYFKLVSKGQDHSLLNLSANNNQSRILADSKGAMVWDMLARTLGREVFSRILKNLINEHKYERVGWQQFVSALETGSGQDLKSFVTQWIEQTGAPDYSLTWTQEGRTLQGTVSQTAPYFRAELEIEVKGSGGKLVKLIQISKEQASFNWTVPFRAETVTLDPYYRVLRWTPEFHVTGTGQPKIQ
jgi:hypothetical protein